MPSKKDDEAVVEAEAAPPEAEPAAAPAAGQITVTASANVRGLAVGAPTVVDDDDEWRALAATGLVTIAG